MLSDVDGDSENETEKEELLPALAVGDVVPVEACTPEGHNTTPPARFTEASLVKRRRTRHWSTVDVGLDYSDDSRSRIRLEEGSSTRPHMDGVRCRWSS